MSSLKKVAPALESCCKLIRSRSLHSVSNLGAKAKRSPKVIQKTSKAADVHALGIVRVRRPINLEESLPPIALLQAGHKSGALDIPPEKALEVLRNYQELERMSSSGWERKLCDDHEVSPHTLGLMGRILNRCPSNAQRSLARKVMFSASALGENSSTFELIESALIKKTIHLKEFEAPLRQLGILAKQERDPEAMVLLGKFLLSLGKDDQALDWLRRATQSGSDFNGASEALVQEGRLLLHRKDKHGAENAFRKAALDLDDPSAYFYLSQLQEPTSSQREVYLLKAASSGIVEACHNLGSLEMEKVKQRVKEPGSIHDFDMAKEWFQVAAADGFGLSMLNLALICKAGGNLDEGLIWLEKAEGLPEVSIQARSVRAQWGSQKVEIS